MSEDRTEVIICFENAIIVRWNMITEAGLRRVVERTKALQDEVGGKTSYIALVAASCPIPSDTARASMSKDLKQMQEWCRSISLIFLGTGIKVAALRSIAASMFLLSGNRAMAMAADLPEAAAKAGFSPEKVKALTFAAHSNQMLD